MVRRYECEVCDKDFRTLSGAEWHMDRFHEGDTSRLAKGKGPISLSEYILIDLATHSGTFQRYPGLKARAEARMRESIEQDLMEQ